MNKLRQILTIATSETEDLRGNEIARVCVCDKVSNLEARNFKRCCTQNMKSIISQKCINDVANFYRKK